MKKVAHFRPGRSPLRYGYNASGRGTRNPRLQEACAELLHAIHQHRQARIDRIRAEQQTERW